VKSGIRFDNFEWSLKIISRFPATKHLVLDVFTWKFTAMSDKASIKAIRIKWKKLFKYLYGMKEQNAGKNMLQYFLSDWNSHISHLYSHIYVKIYITGKIESVKKFKWKFFKSTILERLSLLSWNVQEEVCKWNKNWKTFFFHVELNFNMDIN